MWQTAVQVICSVVLLSPVLLTLHTVHAQAVYSGCGGTISDREFRLTSPPWLSQSMGDTCCEYCIVAASPAVCNLEVKFLNFLLPPSGDGSCSSDSLTIGEQKLCGGIAGVKVFPFRQPNMHIQFQGSSNGNGKGFDLLIRQQECTGYENQRQSVCGGEFYDSVVTISSPGYPNGYDNHLDCVYTIRQPEGGTCDVDVSFDNTVIEYSDNCLKDKLIIENDILCGRISGSRRYRVKGKMTIRFVSDSYASELGFRLRVKTIRCLDRDSIQVFTDSPERQSVGGYDYPPYVYPQPVDPFPIPDPKPSEPFPSGPNNNLYPPPGSRYPEPSGLFPSGPNNNLFPPGNRYPEPTTGRPLNEQPYYPNNGPPCMTYFGNNRYVFSAQPCNPNFGNYPNNLLQNYPQPFYPNYQPSYPPVTSDVDQQQCCGRIYNSQHFLIVSPGFPKSRPANCLYTITRSSPNVCMLRFQFRYFWVGEEDSNSGCPGEFLNIDGRTFCGCKTGLVWTSPFAENSGLMKVLILQTNGASDKPISGFVIEVFQDECQTIRRTRNPNNSSENLIDSNVVIVNNNNNNNNNDNNNNNNNNNTSTEETTDLLFENTTPQWESDSKNTSLEIRELEVKQSNLVLPATKSGVGSINRIFDTSTFRPNSQFAWDPFRQLWYLPRTAQCIRWGLNDWLLLIRESLWSQYQCPANPTATNTQINPYQGGRQNYQLQTQNC